METISDTAYRLKEPMTLKLVFKKIFVIISFIFDLPLIIPVWLESIITRNKSERIFCFCAEILSQCPGFIGSYFRRAYYWAVCTDVSSDAHFLLGSLLAHRQNKIGAHSTIGIHTYIGYADIAENVLMGARVSIISGKYQHGRPGQRISGVELAEENTIIRIGKNTWIGQDASLLANIGENCTIAAGSVVFKDVPDNTTVMGNPARKVSLNASESS
jgi:virginiamycin A acetyltransferase